MRSSWGKKQSEEQQTPVEMRFIDMFMTALGGLVFICLLLVVLLPKVTLPPALEDLEEQNRRLRQENEKQNRQLQQLRTEDLEIISRWLGVFVLASGCKSDEPELYVRWEHEIIDLETNERLPDAKLFNATNPTDKTTLYGQRYFDIGDQLATVPGFDALKNDDVHAKLFYGVSRKDGWYSIYVGLKDGSAQGDRDCAIYPIYLSSHGRVNGDKLILNQWRPYAWLRHLRINVDGSTTVTR
jgi:hypothetical protein